MIILRGGRALVGSEMLRADVGVAAGPGGGALTLSPSVIGSALELDASGLYVLPGLVDIHGDAFERQIMPRPGVSFDLATALSETNSQLIANGITTAFLGLTWSWEPGFRGAESAHALVSALARLAPRLSCDVRLHLRHETYNLDAEPQILRWIADGRVSLLAFNDHLAGTITTRLRPDKKRAMADRAGLDESEFDRLVERVASRGGEVAGSIRRLAAAAHEARIPTMSHDDMTVADRDAYRAIGVAIAEFPVTEDVARSAANAGDSIVFGAPNVMRGGSHTGCPSAADMVLAGCCTILASDYYYPSLLAAPFALVEKHGMPLADAWRQCSRAPALASGLADRGQISEGARADVIMVERTADMPPRVIATISAGKLAYLAESSRILRAAALTSAA